MILFVALAMLIGVFKKKRPFVVFKEVSLLPMAMLELIFWLFQFCAWMGDYRFIPYASMLQSLYILSLIWPILKFRLYGRAVIGGGMVMIGTVLNRLVMAANDGHMPVYPTLSRLTGYFVNGAMEASGDAVHVLMTQSTHLKGLGDYIDVGFSIMSPGDVLIHGFITLIILGVIEKVNRKEPDKSTWKSF